MSTREVALPQPLMPPEGIVPPKPLLTASKAAERLNVSVFFLRKLLREGYLQSVQIGRLRRVRPEDLEEFIAARTNGKSR